MMWLGAWWLACGSIALHDTARITSMHTHEIRTSVSVQRDATPVVGVLPVPIVDAVYRVPLDGDTDIGLKLLGGAPGFDVRRRLIRGRRFDLTVAPSLSGAYVPLELFGLGGGGVSGLGFANLSTPVVATAQLSRRQSLTLSARPGVRLISSTSSGEGTVTEGVNRMSPLLATGLRWEIRGARHGFAVGVDVLARPGRGAPLAWSVSLQDVVIRNRLRHRAHRRMKRSVRQGAR